MIIFFSLSVIDAVWQY